MAGPGISGKSLPLTIYSTTVTKKKSLEPNANISIIVDVGLIPVITPYSSTVTQGELFDQNVTSASDGKVYHLS